MRKVKDKSNGKEIKRSKAWKRTHNLECQIPKFQIHCYRCRQVDGVDMPMAMRHSNILLSKDESVPIGTHKVCYKCPKCGWFITFMPHDNSKYLRKILKLRDGNSLFVPTTDDWSEESDLIKQQLKNLGYWGG